MKCFSLNIYLLLTFLVVIFPLKISSLVFEDKLFVKNFFTPINYRLENVDCNFSQSTIIDNEVNAFLQRNSIKGASLAVVKDERLVFCRSYGYADDYQKVNTSINNIFRIASVSKLITAVAIMKLVDEGKIKLTDKIFGPNGFFNDPQYLDIKDKRIEDITVLNLLDHSGGWTQLYGDPMFNPTLIAKKVGDSLPATPETYLKFVLSRNLHFTPGASYSYSNMGYMFLGLVIEKVTGFKYEDYVRQFILFPCGVYDMHIGKNLFEEKYPNEVRYHEQFGAEKIKAFDGDSAMVAKVYGGNDITLLGGAGGWVASAVELAKLMVVIDGYDKIPDILSKQSIQLMAGGLEKTLGWRDIDENGNWYRTGSFAGTAAMLCRRVDGIEWVLLCNTTSWEGPHFSRSINRLMNKITNSVDRWPDRDLFQCIYR
jgi:CubicO group peptidase (beta-lactamase class C family)